MSRVRSFNSVVALFAILVQVASLTAYFVSSWLSGKADRAIQQETRALMLTHEYLIVLTKLEAAETQFLETPSDSEEAQVDQYLEASVQARAEIAKELSSESVGVGGTPGIKKFLSRLAALEAKRIEAVDRIVESRAEGVEPQQALIGYLSEVRVLTERLIAGFRKSSERSLAANRRSIEIQANLKLFVVFFAGIGTIALIHVGNSFLGAKRPEEENLEFDDFPFERDAVPVSITQIGAKAESAGSQTDDTSVRPPDIQV